jgi:hypothetical protein
METMSVLEARFVLKLLVEMAIRVRKKSNLPGDRKSRTRDQTVLAARITDIVGK